MAPRWTYRGTPRVVRKPTLHHSIFPPPRRLKKRTIEYETAAGRDWWWKE